VQSKKNLIEIRGSWWVANKTWGFWGGGGTLDRQMGKEETKLFAKQFPKKKKNRP